MPLPVPSPKGSFDKHFNVGSELSDSWKRQFLLQISLEPKWGPWFWMIGPIKMEGETYQTRKIEVS